MTYDPTTLPGRAGANARCLASLIGLCWLASACPSEPPPVVADESSGTTEPGSTSTPTSDDSSSSSSSSDVTSATVEGSSSETHAEGSCGDGVLDPGELCDDGPMNGEYDQCAADCHGPGPHCGDGRQTRPEACDDGVNDGTYGGCVADCSARGPHCGDGSLQASETCDDGNVEIADGCNDDCLPSGDVIWLRTFRPDDSEWPSRASELLALESGEVVAFVGGPTLTALDGADGTTLWGQDVSDPAVTLVNPTDMVLEGDGFLLGGGAQTFGGDYEGWIAHWEVGLLSPDAERYDDVTGIFAVAVAPNGDRAAVGTTSVLGGESFLFFPQAFPLSETQGQLTHVVFDDNGDLIVSYNPYEPPSMLRKYTPDGFLVWETPIFEGEELFPVTSVLELQMLPDGSVAVGGLQNGSSIVCAMNCTIGNIQTTNGFIARYDADGTPLWETYYPQTAWLDIAVDTSSSDVIAVGAMAGPADTLLNVVAKYDADGNERWFATEDSLELGNPWLNHVAVGPDREIFVAGTSLAARLTP